jgi:magnesium-protoporphyrin O-methyltransferase
VFGENSARSLLKRYRKKGPGKPTRLLLDALTHEGVNGLTLLDIGGGVGMISFELFKAGLANATQVDASSAFVMTANGEATREGLSERFTARQGDFVALANQIPEAGVVTLDKVICCYPNMPALVGQSAAKATRLYGAVYPRDVWWARMAGALLNGSAWLFRMPLRNHSYATAAVDAVIREQGLSPRYQRNTGYWQVVVYGR